MAVFMSALLSVTIVFLVGHEALAAPSVKGPYSRTFYTDQQDYDGSDSSELTEEFSENWQNGVQSPARSQRSQRPNDKVLDPQQPYSEKSSGFSESGSYIGSGDYTTEEADSNDKNFQDASVDQNTEQEDQDDDQNIKQEEEYDGSWSSWWNRRITVVVNAPRKVFNSAREYGSAAAEDVANLWGKLKGKIGRTYEKFKNYLQGHDPSVRQGAEYSAHVLQRHSTDDTRGADFLQKLENNLKAGNDEVKELFQLLGDKISAVFTGRGVDGSQGRTDDIFQQEDIPDLFQDEEVQGQIEKLVAHGIIEQEEADLFTQQTTRPYY